MKAIYDLMKSNNIKTITEKYTHNINELDKHLNANFFSKLLRNLKEESLTFYIRRDYFFDNKENSIKFVDYYRKTNGETLTSPLSKKYYFDDQNDIIKTEKYDTRNKLVDFYSTKFTYDDNGNLTELHYEGLNSYDIQPYTTMICKYNDRGMPYDCALVINNNDYFILYPYSIIRFIFEYDYDNDIAKFSFYVTSLDNVDTSDYFSPTIITDENLIKQQLIALSQTVESEELDFEYWEDFSFWYRFYDIEKLNRIAKKLYNGNTTRFITYEDVENTNETIHFLDVIKNNNSDNIKYVYNGQSSNNGHSYQNDSRGNWIKKTGFINNKQVVIAERTIEYYD